ncbi:MAG: hypothetical protein WCO68_11355 [Verrucomicrobiota bacterium]
MKKRNARRTKKADALEARRERQRAVCHVLLECWIPVATSDRLALRSEGRTGPVIDEEALEAGLKAGAYVLKVLERLARLDGLDAAEKRELTAGNAVDPVELARRVRAVSPMLMARLQLASPPVEEMAPD